MTEQRLTEQLLAMKSSELRAWIIETRARLRQAQMSEQHRVLGATPNARDRAILATLSDVIAFLDAMTLRIGRDLQMRRRDTHPLPAIVQEPDGEIEDLGEGEDIATAKTLELVALQPGQHRLRKVQLKWGQFNGKA